MVGMDWNKLVADRRFMGSRVNKPDHGSHEPSVAVYQKDAQRILFTLPHSVGSKARRRCTRFPLPTTFALD